MESRVPETERTTSLAAVLWPLAKRFWPHWVAVLIAMPTSAVMAMLAPYLTKVAIDTYIVPAAEAGTLAGVWDPLLELVGLMALVVLGGYAADATYVAVLQRAGHRMIALLRDVLYRHTLRLPRSYFDTHPIGTILTRVTSDIESIQESLATGVLSLFMEFAKSVGYLTMMFLLDWRLTLVLLAVFPVLAGLIVFFQARIRYHFFHARQALSEATGYLQEILNGIKTVQLFGAERKVLERYRRKNARHLHQQNRSNFYDALLYSLVEGVTTLSLALMLWYAAGELLAGVLTLGVLVAFIEYIQRLFVPVREFSQQVAVIQRAFGALDHIDGLFRTPVDPAEAGDGRAPGAMAARTAAPAPLESIVFDDVRFRYRPETPEVLRGISFEVRRGQSLAIVGPTGSGKSTVIRLLTRAYSGYQGSIRINGRELSDIPVEALSRMISVVHQNVFLFHGDVAFNIGLERDWISAEQIRRAADYVNAHAFISELDGGYRAPVVQGGANLSVGQGQLIALARAVAAHTDLIVLDEATASIDSINEQRIQAALDRLYGDKTVIAIAHRLSTIRKADQILVMADGQIAERGDHTALIRQGGLYAELVGELLAEREEALPDSASPPSIPTLPPGEGEA